MATPHFPINEDYALVLMPPKNIIDFVDQYRQKYAKYTKYIIPPHFTIYPPFRLKDVTEEEIINLLQTGFAGTAVKQVNCQSVNYFEYKNSVAYFEPDQESSDYLKTILIKVIQLLAWHTVFVYKSYGATPENFVAHMTIAESIPASDLPKIKEELAKIDVNFSFKVSSICLFKRQQNSQVWEIVKEIKFLGK